MQDDNKVIQPGGLSTDSSLVNQPENMTRFVLNGVNETINGDRGFIANEESNEICYEIPAGFTPIGKVYIGNDETLIFLCSTSGNSMLAIVDKDCNLTVQVDDTDQVEKFGFRIDKQIDATYRLRRGCERIVYWIDPKPRNFIIEKPEKFQTPSGDWDISKFLLAKKYGSIPNIDTFEVLNSGGNCLAGSYNFSIQYLDEDLNPTEFVLSTGLVKVYNSDFTLPFRDVRGSTNAITEYQNFGKTDKSIKITLSNLDITFPFYRLAITEATSGTGQITDTKFTSEISTQNKTFTYTGTNFESSGSQTEVLIFNSIIEEAGSIEQLENRLLLFNVKGKDVNLCNLQKYASRIAADMVTRTISLTSLTQSNSKHASADFDGQGYMPGEIYSFGIVYIFDDNTLSPVFHIPGKSNLISPTTVFNAGVGVYPMALNNTSADNRYIDNSSCNGGIPYWGVDSEGTSLTNQLVRHHRFPLRTDVKLPLLTRIESETTTNAYKRIKTNIAGSIPVPTTCPEVGEPGYDPACVPVVANIFQYQIRYTKDADTTVNTFTGNVNPADYEGTVSPQTISENDLSNPILAAIITFLSLDESQEDGSIIRLSGTLIGGVFTANSDTGDKLDSAGNPTGVIVPGRGLDYTISLSTEVVETKEEEFISDMFGIQFSNIEMPSEAELNGNKIIGYYIVRNERIEDEKTILDSGVLVSTTQNENYVSSGLLMPENNPVDKNIKKDILTLINPEFKFNSKKYRSFTKILQQGRFDRTEAIHSRTKLIDVQDGNSYQSRHKDAENSRFQGNGENGPDGFMMQIKTRDNICLYKNEADFEIDESKIKEIFYVPALGDKLISDSSDTGVTVFNLACDNQVGIVSLTEEVTFPITNSVPYVYLIRDSANPYNNFRLTPYYKELQNPIYFGVGMSKCTVFNGDSYVTPIRYVNSLFHDNRLRLRASKTSAWNYIGAALLVVVAVVIAIFSWGSASAGSVALVSLAAGLVGGAATLVASGIKQDAWAKAYSELYDKGLRQTIQDEYVLFDKDPDNGEERGFNKNPPDDEIQWMGDCLNLWFESAVNMNLRQGATDNTPDFLNAPGNRELGVNFPESDEEYFGIHSVRSRVIPPTTALDNHMVKKLTYFESTRKGSKAYVGLALAEVYQINLDYNRRNKEKIFNHLALEYDCCSDCNETFPHRYHYSEQAFQEELTDNFRAFLPNNYRDIEGETGVITDAFRIQNNLYIHTEEALWHQPQNFQERVTSDIISFIGTGDYFSIPPRKVVDDSNSSAGNIHKWARLKTRHGVLFPCHKEKKWYIYNGESLRPISDTFNSNYFKENMNFKIVNDYYTGNKIKYPYDNNPSNSIGVGYISTYDTKKERLLTTKKDFKITNLPTSDYEICNEGEGTIIFENISDIIATQLLDGWNYIGMEDCKLKFQKTAIETRTETRTIIINIPNDTIVYNFYDTSGSFPPAQLAQIKASAIAWYQEFRPGDTLDPVTGEGAYFKHIEDASERWLNYPATIPAGGNAMVLTYVNEANAIYHGSSIEAVLSAPTAQYITDYNNFINTVFPSFTNFIGISYPIMTAGVASTTGGNFLQHSLAAIKGRNYTALELTQLEYNTAYTPTNWNSLINPLLSNPYSVLVDGFGAPGLEQFNWVIKSNKNDLGTAETPTCPASPDIISPCQFAEDINDLLADFTSVIEIEVIVNYPVINYKFIEGSPITPTLLNNSFTMSYSLKDTKWISWHSYLPSFYMHVQEKFYSWKEGLNNLWRHGKKGSYQTFYGEFHPFIIEYVDNSNAVITKIYDAIKFQTEAKQYDADNDFDLDKRYITFNKIIAYNTHQISGLMNMIVKDEELDYMPDQIVNDDNTILIDRNERNWGINDLRDLSIDTSVAMFNKNLTDLQANYFIDKIINNDRIDYNKDWTEMESFRDKFLVVRLIFDTFDNTRLLMNFSIQDSKISER